MDTYKSSSALETGEKISVIGEASVGKTSIIKRYVNQKFEKSCQATIGFEQYSKMETVDG
jgi:GTPase SAR1 family protein